MADLSTTVAGLSKNFSGRLLLPTDSDWEAARIRDMPLKLN